MSDLANITLPSSSYRVPSGLAYLKLPEAILEILEVVVCVGALISLSVAPDKLEDESSYWHLQMVCGIFIVVTGAIIVLFMLNIPQRTTRFPWGMLIVFYCAGAAIGLMALAAHVAANTFGNPGLIIGTALAFMGMVFYFIEIFFAIRAWKRSIIAETLRLVEEGKLGVSMPPSQALEEHKAI